MSRHHLTMSDFTAALKRAKRARAVHSGTNGPGRLQATIVQSDLNFRALSPELALVLGCHCPRKRIGSGHVCFDGC